MIKFLGLLDILNYMINIKFMFYEYSDSSLN